MAEGSTANPFRETPWQRIVAVHWGDDAAGVIATIDFTFSFTYGAFTASRYAFNFSTIQTSDPPSSPPAPPPPTITDTHLSINHYFHEEVGNPAVSQVVRDSYRVTWSKGLFFFGRDATASGVINPGPPLGDGLGDFVSFTLEAVTSCVDQDGNPLTGGFTPTRVDHTDLSDGKGGDWASILSATGSPKGEIPLPAVFDDPLP